MILLGILGGSFLEPDPLNWLWGTGLGTNIGASIIWGFLAGFVGYFIAKRVRRAWGRMHDRITELHARHDEHADAVAHIAARVEALHARLDQTPETKGSA